MLSSTITLSQGKRGALSDKVRIVFHMLTLDGRAGRLVATRTGKRRRSLLCIYFS